MAKEEKGGLAAGVRDNSRGNRPVPATTKKAKYGWHGKKNLSKTKTY